MHLSVTPEHHHHHHHQASEPVTPARDPATIDRRGLVGVGELTTPRWTRSEHSSGGEAVFDLETVGEAFEVVVPEATRDDDEPDSPWTIEAVDGEYSEREEVCQIHYLSVIDNSTSPTSRWIFP